MIAVLVDIARWLIAALLFGVGLCFLFFPLPWRSE